MNTKRLITGTVLAGVLGAWLMLGAGPMVSSAEAGRRYREAPQRSYKQQGSKHHYKHPRRVNRYHRPSRVVRYYPTRHHRPWYYGARTVYVNQSPFYFNVGLGVYLGGGVNLGIQFGNAAPAGYAYADPYCSLQFSSVNAYNRHLVHYNHSPVLRVVYAPVCR
jgi:hypothetical protein